MISDFTITDLRNNAVEHRTMATYWNENGFTPSAALRETMAKEYEVLADIAELLNSDARLRDALGEARDRAAGALSGIQVVNLAAAEGCAECGDLTLVLVDGSPLCEPCFDVANAVNLVPVEHDRATCGECIEQYESDLAPSDAQDDEAREVEIS